MRNPISKHRLSAFRRQRGRCYYCGLPMWLRGLTAGLEAKLADKRRPARLQCTAEHLIARQDGGSDSARNIVAACRFCNSTRHKLASPLEPEQFRLHVTRRIRAGKWHPRQLLELLESRKERER